MCKKGKISRNILLFVPVHSYDADMYFHAPLLLLFVLITPLSLRCSQSHAGGQLSPEHEGLSQQLARQSLLLSSVPAVKDLSVFCHVYHT